jgi:hypothetical protein
MKDKKFTNPKAHNCHMLTTQLLLVALRDVLPEKVCLALVKLCAFLNAISQMAIVPRNLVKLHNDVVQCLVRFELAFPPSLFNIMTHLLVHLVKENTILGLVFLHNMWPFESVEGVYLYQTSFGLASRQVLRCSQGTLLPSSVNPRYQIRGINV